MLDLVYPVRLTIIAVVLATVPLVIAIFPGGVAAGGPTLQITQKCPEEIVPSDNGGYGTIITQIRVKKTSCRKGAKVLRAVFRGEALPAGWSCHLSKKTQFYNCRNGKKRARGVSGGSASVAAGGAWKSCKGVAFEKHTDWGALEIRAKNVGCKTARKVARAAKGEGISGEYSSHGFDCTGQAYEPDFGLPYSRWRCVDGSRKVRFKTT